MPAFETPQPISAVLELVAADVDITSGDRTDTVVTIRPAGDSEASKHAAEQTVIEHKNGKLLIKTPKPRRGLFSRSRSAEDEKDSAIVVTIELPAGSDIRGEAALGYLTGHGRLGNCRFDSACGSIQLEETADLHLEAALGDVTVNRVNGTADITTTQGNLKLDFIDGPAHIKNLSGATAIGEVTGDLRVTATSGEVSIGRAHSGVTAKNTNGDIYVGEVMRGAIDLETTRGSLGVGVREGTTAHLDASSRIGGVRNTLAESGVPGDSVDTVRLRTRTVIGEINVHRA
ncbi:DUF4097 domain-containing protein [Streptomyces sp. NPDC056255]|uniref:DUF4097 family beta strand repeat-containing protein n=1 Tax=Streptomyces sp. NPDC056255 TaxID=3345764 RepID=UPI0035DF606D